MFSEIDDQIKQAYQALNQDSRQHIRLRERYGSDVLVDKIPFPYSYEFTKDALAVSQTSPALQEMTRLTAKRPGIYRLKGGITYHPNSQTPREPFVCRFNFPLPDGMDFLGRTRTEQVIINPNLELDENLLEIRREGYPVIHIWGALQTHVCIEAGCHTDERCQTFSFDSAMPVEPVILDPTKEYLEGVGLNINIAGLSQVSREFLQRAHLKRRFSPFSKDIDKYRDDYTVFENMKSLGLAIISPRTATFDLNNPQTGFALNRYERFLEMHVPFDVESLNTFELIRAIPRTFELVADYILLHNLRTKYMVGITYERLARLTERLGFTVFEVNLDESVKKHFEAHLFNNPDPKKVNPRAKRGYGMGKILVAFQETDKFLDRFAGVHYEGEEAEDIDLVHAG